MKHDILVHDVLKLLTCVQYHMKRFVEKVVSLMKDEKLFASQGGPIILSQVPSPLVSSMLVHQFTNSCFSTETTYNKISLQQVENEYNNVAHAYKDAGLRYVRWAGNMAVDLKTGVPWVMCKEKSAPGPVVSLHSSSKVIHSTC